MGEYEFPLRERHLAADQTMMFRFDTTGTDFHYKAGQSADFELPIRSKHKVHTFTLSSSPSTPDSILITTRMRDSPYKRALRDLPLGTKVKVRGPDGEFTLHKDAKRPAVCIAGGIGITPIRSMIKAARAENRSHAFYVFYSNRAPGAAAFLGELEEWSVQDEHLTLVPTITAVDDPSWKYWRGRIDEEMLRRHIPSREWRHAVFYVSGPPKMVAGVTKMLRAAGIAKDRIRTDEFEGY